ncbi:recombinase family protein [Mycobacteroides abscessus]|nr:recombinase family protein [Mycobacteroides abscessus]MDM2180503.1 recombinase family protein [Mycobacteroides abscessus]MDM2209719.1 recombinase family protein [Mycobacteroides abscessus]MDM2214745.1 recombinase family protein [Mycobacteroides abscessus]MDM2219736.1 recombinase family protein [Mycobacteroides abscessus]
MKALIVTRLSRVTDATTSPQRQRQECERLCAERRYEVTAVCEDLDVSGAVNPFERPALSSWLTTRANEFDVIVCWRVDRLTRSIRHLQELMHWAEDHGKVVVSATEPHFDTSSPFAPVVIALMGTVAQMELEAIRERTTSAAQYQIRKGTYRGGIPPLGYLPDEDGQFIPDPPQVAILHEVVHRVLDGQSLKSISHDLTRRAVPTPRDRFAEVRGRATRDRGWSSSALRRSLTSPTLLGHVVVRNALTDRQGRVQRDAKGRKAFGPETVLRDDTGSPVVRAQPVLTRELFDRVGAELERRTLHREPPTPSLLLGIVFCRCGKAGYRLKGGPGRSPRIRCASATSAYPCGNRSIPLEYAEDEIQAKVLGALGNMRRVIRVWDQGTDHSDELAEVDATLTDLTNQLGVGPFRAGTPQRAALDQRIQALSDRQAQLASVPSKPAGWRWEETDDIVLDWYTSADIEARNAWLRSLGVRAVWSSHTDERGRTEVDSFEVSGSVADLGRFLDDGAWTVQVEDD